MNEIQRLQMNMLIRLDEVCHRHGLRYYLAYGTCIGAMRHQGFIPWDHDVDVLMPVQDAKKLPQYQEEFGDRYFVTSFRTDPTYKSIAMRIVDREHRCRETQDGKVTEEMFVAMDIYPFYNCPKSQIALTLQVWRSHVYKMLVGGAPKNHGTLMKLAANLILLFHPKKNRERDIARLEAKLDYRGESDSIADYYGRDITVCNAITYRKEWFAEPKRLRFEDREFDAPTDPDRYLTTRYGDYMTPPSSQDREHELKCELIP